MIDVLSDVEASVPKVSSMGFPNLHDYGKLPEMVFAISKTKPLDLRILITAEAQILGLPSDALQGRVLHL